MNRSTNPIPQFAVNRAAMLSRLPGVDLSVTAKRFIRQGPRLESIRVAPNPLSTGGRLGRRITNRRETSRSS